MPNRASIQRRMAQQIAHVRSGFGADLAGAGAGASSTSLPTGITSLTLMNDYSIPVTSPAANNAPVPLNGRALRVVTTAAASSVDPSKLTGTITRPGFDSSGNTTSRSYAINYSQRIRRPSGNTAQFSLDSNGTDYVFGAMDLAPDITVYRADTIALTFASGFVTGSGAGSVTNAQITRSDNRQYRAPVGRPLSRPHRVYRGNTNAFEIVAGCDNPQQISLLACVKAFLIDSGGTKGTVSTSGTMVVSVDADGALSGLQGLCYRVNLDTTGLVDGPATVYYQLVPWDGDTIWDSRTFGEVWPTRNHPKGLPCLIDNANNYTPIYALVSQAKTGLTGASLLGLCATKAGAIAAAAPYASEKDAATALKTLNNAATNQTILSDDGLSTKSYKRPTAPHNDCDGLVIVVLPVSGSAANVGTASYATGSYSWTVNAPQATCPITYVPVVITTQDGAYDDAVRYTSGGVTSNLNKIPFRMVDWVGITFDYGTATGADATAIYGSTAGVPSTQPTDATSLFHDFTSCRDLGAVATAHGSNGVTSQLGYTSWRKGLLNFETGSYGMGQVTAAFGGNIGFIGCVINKCVTFTPTMMLGTRVINTSILSQAAADIQPNTAGFIFGNCEVHNNAPSAASFQIGASRPIRDVLLWSYLVRMANAGSTVNVSISADNAITSAENIIDICRTSAGQRTNVNYTDQGYIGAGTDAVILYPADEQYNTKHDAFNAPEIPSNSTPNPAVNYISGTAYWKGAIVHDMPKIASMSGDGTTTTCTLTGAPPAGVIVGSQIKLNGITTSAFNGTWTIASVVGSVLTWLSSANGAATLGTAYVNTAAGGSIYQATRDIPAPAALDSVTLTAGGSGYTYALVTLSGGGASTQAQVNAVLANGAVIGFRIITPGSGYSSNPTVAITGDGSGATATATYCAAAIALTNTAYFVNAATLYGSNQFNTAYGEKSLRTDNWGCRYHVDHKGKVSRHSFNDLATNATTNNTFGETGASNTYFGRGGQLKAYTASVGWYKRNTAQNNTEATFGDPSGTNVTVVNPTTPTQVWNPANDFGDFRPKSVAGGDATDSNLLARIPSGFAPFPQDSFGTAYSNTGDNSGAVHT